MVLVIGMRELVDEPVVRVVEFGPLALGDRVDLLLGEARLQPEPDMRRPFELCGPVPRRDEDRDLGLLRRERRPKPDMSTELVRVIARPGLFSQTCTGGGTEPRGPALQSFQMRRCSGLSLASSCCS